MKCPFCNAVATQVKDSRPAEDISSVRRRRECVKCKNRFTTIEKVQLKNIVVVKKSGEKMPFDREKIRRSINIAFRKRKFLPEKIDSIVNQVISKIEAMKDNEITSELIGEFIMTVLSEVDHVAYIRFASVYKEFSEVGDFEVFLHKLVK